MYAADDTWTSEAAFGSQFFYHVAPQERTEVIRCGDKQESSPSEPSLWPSTSWTVNPRAKSSPYSSPKPSNTCRQLHSSELTVRGPGVLIVPGTDLHKGARAGYSLHVSLHAGLCNEKASSASREEREVNQART